MAILKVIKPLKANGEILYAGEILRTKNKQALLDKGYARTLFKSEVDEILDKYVRYAQELFNGKQNKTKKSIGDVQESLF